MIIYYILSYIHIGNTRRYIFIFFFLYAQNNTYWRQWDGLWILFVRFTHADIFLNRPRRETWCRIKLAYYIILRYGYNSPDHDGGGGVVVGGGLNELEEGKSVYLPFLWSWPSSDWLIYIIILYDIVWIASVGIVRQSIVVIVIAAAVFVSTRWSKNRRRLDRIRPTDYGLTVAY